MSKHPIYQGRTMGEGPALEGNGRGGARPRNEPWLGKTDPDPAGRPLEWPKLALLALERNLPD